jgi:glutathione S-transferase
MVLVKANTETEAGILPSPEFFAAMGKFNEELVKAGVMQAGEGLKPSAQGARVTFRGT